MNMKANSPWITFWFAVIMTLMSGFWDSSKAQSLVIEFQSTDLPAIPGNHVPGFQPGAMDADGDGKNDIILRQGNRLLIYTQNLKDTFILDEQDMALPWLGFDQLTPLGFYNILGDTKKELVMAPGRVIDSVWLDCYYVVVLERDFDGHFHSSFSWGYTPCWGMAVNARNIDADDKAELIVLTAAPGNKRPTELHVFGEGFTPGVSGDPGAMAGIWGESSGTGKEFSLLQVLPPNFRLPLGFSMFPSEAMQDYDGDGKIDFGFIRMGMPADSILIVSGKNQQLLYSGPVPPELAQQDDPYFLGYHDFYHSGQKQILIGTGSKGAQFRDMEAAVVIDPATAEVNTSLLPYMEQDFRMVAISNWIDDSLLWVIAMEKLNTRRVILLTVTDGFQGDGLPGVVEGGSDISRGGGEYVLQKVWTSDWPSPFIPKRKPGWNTSELDPDEDQISDLPIFVLVDSAGTSVSSLRVYSGKSGDLIWDSPITAEDSLELDAFFHGFYNVDGKNNLEVYIGKNTVITSDGAVHHPFESGFRVLFLIDLNGDGHEEVIGQSADQFIHVYSKSETNWVSDPLNPIIQSARIVPNPATGPIQAIWYQDFSGDILITISDLEGREIIQQVLKVSQPGEQQLAIDLPDHLTGGFYLCHWRYGHEANGIPFIYHPK